MKMVMISPLQVQLSFEPPNHVMRRLSDSFKVTKFVNLSQVSKPITHTIGALTDRRERNLVIRLKRGWN